MISLLNRQNSKEVHVNDMDTLIGNVELIDIREPYEYARGSLRTAKNIPMGTLLYAPEKYLLEGKTYYIMCRSGGRSSSVCRVLKKQGFDVVNVSGGMASYVGTKRK